MRKFVEKVVFFLVILVPILIMGIYLSHLEGWREYFCRITDSNNYIESSVNGSDEIKPFIWKVREQNNTEILVIGDSICHQMFENISENNGDITYAASNAAITMAGQYILAKEYLDNHANAKEIYLIVHPTSLKRTFDTTYGYQYIIIPFSETNTLMDLDKGTVDICKTVYGDVFLEPEVVNIIDKSGMNRKLYLNLLKKYGKSYEEKMPFEIADEYISKIYGLCEERNVKFYLVSSPVSAELQMTCEELEKEYTESWMSKICPDYFKNIVYYPAEQSEDGFHFSGEYKSQEYLNRLIKQIFDDYSLVDAIEF